MDDFDTLHDQRNPHSLPAEQALIGAVLRDQRAFERVGDKVNGGGLLRSPAIACTGKPSPT